VALSGRSFRRRPGQRRLLEKACGLRNWAVPRGPAAGAAPAASGMRLWEVDPTSVARSRSWFESREPSPIMDHEILEDRSCAMQIVFSSDLQRFCLNHSNPAPGAVLRSGAPLAKASPAFANDLRAQERSLFEKLLLFDKVQLSVAGPNVIAPLLCNRVGLRTFEELLEQDAISFVVWEPYPLFSHKDGMVKATFNGRIDKGGPLDIEERIDQGLVAETVGGLNSARARKLKQKLLQQHLILDPVIGEEAWPAAFRAMTEGSLASLGLSKRSSIIESPVADGQILLAATESIIKYRHVLANDLATFDDPGVYDLFAMAFAGLERPAIRIDQFATIAEYAQFPNLGELYETLDEPFRRIAAFRNSTTSRNFRAWLSTVNDSSSDVDLIREYVDACQDRRGFFDTAPRKFLKLVSMLAVGWAAGKGATALGADEIITAILTGLGGSTAAEISGKAVDFGLGTIETFMIDNLKVGWSPRAYFDGLRRISRQSKD
jgi:hypothetical protein